jgi:hypothetical protein
LNLCGPRVPMPVKKMCAASRRAVFDESQRRPLLDGRMGAGAKRVA